MRMPNGFGTIYKLSGKRRKPYVAKKTIGFNEKHQPIYKVIGYFKTKKDALESLNDYNRIFDNSPNRSKLFSEVFEEWFQYKLNENLSASRYKNIRSLYNVHLGTLYSKTFKDISTEDLQLCINYTQKICKKATLVQMKILFSELYNYAIFNGITDKDVSVMVKVPALEDKKEKVPFSVKEIETLLNSNEPFAKLIYIMIYTGFRASEFISIKREDISTDYIMIYTGFRASEFISIKREDISTDYIITGGVKSNAGKNRKVPCNKKIIPIIDYLFSDGRTYLVGYEMNYNQFIYMFKKCMKSLEMEHTPHDTRHTFVTMLSNADANKVSIQRLVGHASKDITDSVYTHKDLEQLRKTIELI